MEGRFGEEARTLTLPSDEHPTKQKAWTIWVLPHFGTGLTIDQGDIDQIGGELDQVHAGINQS